MKLARLLFAAACCCAVPEAALAFDGCAASLSNPDEVGREIGRRAIAQMPAKYFETVKNITIVTKSRGEAIIPFAIEQNGAKLIVFPPLFANVVCKIAISTYLVLAGVEQQSFDQAATRAGECIDNGGTQKTCLVAFADELETRYRKAFLAQPEGGGRVAWSMYEAALHQVAMHEYAHHLLNHFARMRKQEVLRIDAEFEADLFAITNGLQSGEPPSAMYYFFSGMSQIESQTQRLSTNDYESSACRASNVDSITGFIGSAPIMMIDAAFGGGFTLTRNSPAAVRAIAEKQFGGPPPSLNSKTCGRLAKVALGDAHAELQRLYLRVALDADLLFAKRENVDEGRANRLVHDLSDMLKGFRYMDSLDAKVIALMLRNWGLKGRALTGLVGEVERLLADPTASANFESEDFGRLLQAQGLATLQERTDLRPQARLNHAFSLLERSVYYNPAQAEAWMNLSFIAFKRADCAAAAGYVENSAANLTSTRDNDRESVVSTARAFREWAADPETCKARSAGFHPYPGL